jgi:hypothetical protein
MRTLLCTPCRCCRAGADSTTSGRSLNVAFTPRDALADRPRRCAVLHSQVSLHLIRLKSSPAVIRDTQFGQHASDH